MDANNLAGELLAHPMPNRQGSWAYRMLPDNTLLEVELTQEEWSCLHGEAIATKNARIQELNAHPLNQAVLGLLLGLLKVVGTGPHQSSSGSSQSGVLDKLHVLSLAELALPHDESQESEAAWDGFLIVTGSVARMEAALSSLEQELDADALTARTPLEAAHLILSALELE